MTELKPCPFCGAVLDYIEERYYTAARHIHPSNGCFLEAMTVLKTDQEDWNRRAEPPQ